MKSNTGTWDRELFRSYLVKNRQCAPRVASDNVSRCNRIERDLGVNLEKSVATVDSYKNLLIQIEQYSELNPTSGLAGTLRKAARYFLEYKVGMVNAQRYPLAYTLGKRYTSSLK